MFQVKKRNGSTEEVNVDKINKCVSRACLGFGDVVSASEIVLDTSKQFYNGIKTEEIDKALVLTTRSKIEKDPAYSYVAARLQTNVLNKEVFKESTNAEDFESHYRLSFINGIKRMVDAGILSKDVLKFNLELLANNIYPERDNLFKYPGVQTLYDRYLLKINGVRVETLQGFWMRVAIGICLKNGHEVDIIDFYEKMSTFMLCPSTPTLFNSATTNPQLSSCYLSTVDDDIDGIMGTWHDQARLSKHAGGIGVDVTNIRAQGTLIKSTGGKAAGVVPYVRILNDVLLGFDQGGRRKGSGAIYLESFHPEVEEFQDLLKNTGDERRRTHDLHTANWIPDLFMKRVNSGGNWLLVCPSEAKELHDTYGAEFEKKYLEYEELARKGMLKNYKIINAKDLARKMLSAIGETGHPWITFKDMSAACYMSKHMGIPHSSNLCTEILEHTKATKYDYGQKKEIGLTAVCNLLSINLKSHCRDGEVDFSLLADTVRVGVNMLDNVIDENYYPIAEAKNSNEHSRHIGLGMMGFADLLHELDIAYESKEAEIESNDIAEFISFHAISASVNLARKRGSYPDYQGSEWSKGRFHHEIWEEEMDKRGFEYPQYESMISKEEWENLRSEMLKYGIRNANIMAIAPNATISFIQGCSETIAPDYSVLFINETLSGALPIINEYFVKECKKLGIWCDELVDAIKRVDGNIELLNIPQRLKDNFKFVFNIDQKRHIDIAAARAKWIDQSQSLNLFYNGDSLKEIWEIYNHLWMSGCKTSYYFKTLGASRSEKTTVDDTSTQSVCSIEAMKRGEVCESCQ